MQWYGRNCILNASFTFSTDISELSFHPPIIYILHLCWVIFIVYRSAVYINEMNWHIIQLQLSSLQGHTRLTSLH